jgi:hypothetical protein
MSNLNIFLPLAEDDPRFCEVIGCENVELATWKVHPQGLLQVEIALCEQHKREAEQEGSDASI